MKELDSLEQEMGQWRPRQPSGRLGRQLFGRKEPAPRTLRRTEFWNWLTPVAACALTVLVAVGSAQYRDKSVLTAGYGTAVDGMSLEAAGSNLARRVVWSERDENVQWNACPKLAPVGEAQIAESPATGGERGAAATNLNRSF
ncbi:MAG TPA: hypothetical protein VN765_04595 [Candidatus Acidoferrum sp.]|nr:hypothetical protein [Candidatus Acidoferrum sp.]